MFTFSSLSDHDAQLISIKCEFARPDEYFFKRSFSENNIIKFTSILSSIDWSRVYNIEDVNSKFEWFCKTISDAFQNSFPKKKYKKKPINNKYKLSKDLKKMANENIDIGILVKETNDQQLKI